MPATKARKAHCAQCGRELKHVIFTNVKNIICKNCYGPDRYRQSTSGTTTAVFEEDRHAEWVARESETAEP